MDILERLFSRFLSKRHYDYSKPQPGLATGQDEDGSLQVEFDNKDYPSLTGVPIYPGLADTSIKIQPGARVLVEWEGGLPTSPVVTAWGKSKVISIAIAGDSKGVARLGDSINCGQLVFKFTPPGALSVTYTPPGGSPQEGLTVNLQGKITSASEVLKTG